MTGFQTSNSCSQHRSTGVQKVFINRFHECHLDLANDVKYSWKSTYIFDYDGKITTDEDTAVADVFPV